MSSMAAQRKALQPTNKANSAYKALRVLHQRLPSSATRSIRPATSPDSTASPAARAGAVAMAGPQAQAHANSYQRAPARGRISTY